MSRLLLKLAVILVFLSQQQLSAFNKEASLVEIEISKTRYDFSMPWIRRSTQTFKNGIVIEGNRILTTADGLSNQHLSRIRKGGITKQYTAELTWVDYYSNLAIYEVEDSDFWTGMEAMPLNTSIPQNGDLEIIRWRNGRIEQRSAEIERLYVGSGKMSYAHHLNLSVSSEINAAGWSEVVIDHSSIIGLTTSSSNNKLTVLPAPFIRTVLERKSDKSNMGMGHFDFRVMHGKNPALLKSKGLQSVDSGVVITEVGKRGIANHILKKGDVILEIDGFTVDTEAKYVDPDYGRLSIFGLATRKHVADEIIPMKVWRDGKLQEISYKLPRADFEQEVIPEKNYDQAPEYLIAGGLLFQPITGSFLDAFGKNTPILLDYYSETNPAPERDGLVVLSGILPDPYNRGYEDARLLIIDTINEQPIAHIKDIESALKKPNGDFHHIRFFNDQSMRHLVIDAKELDSVTSAILKRYNIPHAKFIKAAI